MTFLTSMKLYAFAVAGRNIGGVLIFNGDAYEFTGIQMCRKPSADDTIQITTADQRDYVKRMRDEYERDSIDGLHKGMMLDVLDHLLNATEPISSLTMWTKRELLLENAEIRCTMPMFIQARADFMGFWGVWRANLQGILDRHLPLSI